MSFWNKNKLPPELRELSEEQITERLNAGSAAATEAASQKAAYEAANARATAAEAAATESRRLAEEANSRAEAMGNRGGGDQRQQNVQSGPPTAEDWLTDPNGAYARASVGMSAVALHGAMMSAKLLADQQIRQSGPLDARLWNKYQGEVQKIMDTLAPEQKIMPQVWINQFTYVKGMHASDLIKEGQKAGDSFFSETASASGDSLPDSNNGPQDALTAAEERVAKMLGRTPEDYLKTKRKMQFGPA